MGLVIQFALSITFAKPFMESTNVSSRSGAFVVASSIKFCHSLFLLFLASINIMKTNAEEFICSRSRVWFSIIRNISPNTLSGPLSIYCSVSLSNSSINFSVNSIVTLPPVCLNSISISVFSNLFTAARRLLTNSFGGGTNVFVDIAAIFLSNSFTF